MPYLLGTYHYTSGFRGKVRNCSRAYSHDVRNIELFFMGDIQKYSERDSHVLAVDHSGLLLFDVAKRRID